MLLAQLERLEEQLALRTANAGLLNDLLDDIDGIDPPVTLPSTTAHSFHLYMFRYHPEAFGGVSKQRFIQGLQAEGIAGAFGGYTTPLYKNPMFLNKNFIGGAWPVDAWEHGRSLDYAAFEGLCPVSERACEVEAVWISQTMLLADDQSMRDIALAIKKIQSEASQLL